jgi:hypothetical protein
MRRACLLARCAAAIAVTAGALLTQAGPAAAHSKTFIGLNFGFGYAPWPYYYRPYYYPYYPPVVYAPPPVVYALPQVVHLQPAPMVVNPASAPYVARNGQTCREYQTRAVVGGVSRPVYGTACLQPDGAWRIVN